MSKVCFYAAWKIANSLCADKNKLHKLPILPMMPACNFQAWMKGGNGILPCKKVRQPLWSVWWGTGKNFGCSLSFKNIVHRKFVRPPAFDNVIGRNWDIAHKKVLCGCFKIFCEKNLLFWAWFVGCYKYSYLCHRSFCFIVKWCTNVHIIFRTHKNFNTFLKNKFSPSFQRGFRSAHYRL